LVFFITKNPECLVILYSFPLNLEVTWLSGFFDLIDIPVVRSE